MKYVGEKETKTIFRYLEYLRCDLCNKKININDKYFEIELYNKYDFCDEKHICVDCINKFLKNKTFYDNDKLNLEKTTLYRRPIYDEDLYFMVSDDKGE